MVMVSSVFIKEETISKNDTTNLIQCSGFWRKNDIIQLIKALWCVGDSEMPSQQATTWANVDPMN